MTVRITTDDLLRVAHDAWWEVEAAHKTAWTLCRLDALDRMAKLVTDSDTFDWAYAIWSDYIEGQRHDELFKPIAGNLLREQASIFTRLSRYLPPKELIALASAAWGERVFEVYATDLSTRERLGKIGWFGDRLSIRAVPNRATGLIIGYDFAAWTEAGEVRHRIDALPADSILGLHPVFRDFMKGADR